MIKQYAIWLLVLAGSSIQQGAIAQIERVGQLVDVRGKVQVQRRNATPALQRGFTGFQLRTGDVVIARKGSHVISVLYGNGARYGVTADAMGDSKAQVLAREPATSRLEWWKTGRKPKLLARFASVPQISRLLSGSAGVRAMGRGMDTRAVPGEDLQLLWKPFQNVTGVKLEVKISVPASGKQEEKSGVPVSGKQNVKISSPASGKQEKNSGDPASGEWGQPVPPSGWGGKQFVFLPASAISYTVRGADVPVGGRVEVVVHGLTAGPSLEQAWRVMALSAEETAALKSLRAEAVKEAAGGVSQVSARVLLARISARCNRLVEALALCKDCRKAMPEDAGVLCVMQAVLTELKADYPDQSDYSADLERVTLLHKKACEASETERHVCDDPDEHPFGKKKP